MLWIVSYHRWSWTVQGRGPEWAGPAVRTDLRAPGPAPVVGLHALGPASVADLRAPGPAQVAGSRASSCYQTRCKRMGEWRARNWGDPRLASWELFCHCYLVWSWFWRNRVRHWNIVLSSYRKNVDVSSRRVSILGFQLNLKLICLEQGFLVIRADLVFPENYMEDIRTSSVVTWFFYMMKSTLNLNNMLNIILKLFRSELNNF